MLLLLLVTVSPCAAQVELVYDVNPRSADGWPGNFAVYRGDLHLSATSPEYGSELWRYDGTSLTLAAEVVPGPESGRPYELRTVGDRLFFLADNGATGWEPWLYDGEQAFLVEDIWPGPQGQPSPHGFAVLNDRLFFRANDVVHGYEQWVIEADSARLVADIQPGPGGTSIGYNTPYDGEIFFQACAVALDCELWATDGFNTRLVADISPGADGSFPRDFIEYQGRLVFEASSPEGNGVWMTDGHTTEPAVGFDGADYFDVGSASEFDGALYLGGHTDAAGWELWRYDGHHTEIVADLEPGTDGSYPWLLGEFEGTLYFSTCNYDVYPEPYTCRLWQLEAGGVPEERGNWISMEGGAFAMTSWRGRLYLHVYDDEHGAELWTLEEDGPRLLVDLNPGPASGVGSAVVFEDQFLFSGNDGVLGWELWRVEDPTTGVEAPPEPEVAGLTVYPNPVRGAATVAITLTAPQPVHLDVVDVLGRVVTFLDGGFRTAGTHQLSLATADLAAGPYIVRLREGEVSRSFVVRR
jgi:ELWxxDGT repeat protein